MHILSTWSHSLVARECGKIKIWHQVCVNLWTLVTSTDSIQRSHRMHLFIYRWFNSISSSSAHDAEYTRNIGFRFFIGIFMYGAFKPKWALKSRLLLTLQVLYFSSRLMLCGTQCKEYSQCFELLLAFHLYILRLVNWASGNYFWSTRSKRQQQMFI